MSKKLLSFLGFVLCLFALDAQIIIGKTRYDLQTNNSVQRRAFLDPTNNFLAITYTGSNLTDGAYEDRGTGYAMFNTITNTWIDKSAPFMPPKTTFPGRIEDKRVGWGEPAIVNGKELIISHQSSDGFNGLYMAERSISSLGAYAYKSVTSGKETWPRMAVSGNKIVVISSHFESQFNDVDGGLMFIKSSDGGVTWTAPDSIKGANGINPTNYSGLGGDNYAVDLRGDVIAILTGVYDLTLYKSTDFGVTWTKTNLGRPTSDNFFLDNGEFLTPFDRSDGSYSVLIDNDNKVHCFWGRSYTYGDEEQDIASVFINRFKHGIMYWSENNPKAQVIPQTAFQRESTKQHDDITLKFNTAGTNGSELSYLGSGAVYGSSPVTWPSAGIDDAGNIYLTYGYNRGRLDTTNEGLNKDRDPSGYNFYDVFAIKLMKSDPNKWIGPLNVSQTNTLEETYPSIARRVDGNLHVVYQQDNLVGNAIVTTRDANNNPQNGSGSQVGGIETDNSIVYKKVPVNDIVNPTDITSPLLTFRENFNNLYNIRSTPGGKQYLGTVMTFYKGCTKDSVTGIDVSLNKTFFMNNVFDAFDNVDQRDTNLINFAGLDTINLNQVGTFFFRAWLKDAAGNTSKTTGGSITIDTVMFLVEVKSNDDDKEPPKITINGEQTQYIYRGEAYVELGATVTDDNPCFVGSVSRQGSVNVNTSGKYDITYSATDNSGNQAQSIRTVYVGVEPKASFKDEKLQAGKLIATNTSTGIEIPASYTWYSKKANSINNPRIATTQNLNVNATSAIKAFDSLCLRVQNVFNSAPKNKPISNFCTKFAYSSLTEFNEANLGLRVFPIPSNGSFKVAVDGQYFNKEAKFQMIDLQGRKVAEKTVLINSIEVPLDFNDLAPNPYMLFISIDGAHYQTKVQISK